MSPVPAILTSKNEPAATSNEPSCLNWRTLTRVPGPVVLTTSPALSASLRQVATDSSVFSCQSRRVGSLGAWHSEQTWVGVFLLKPRISVALRASTSSDSVTGLRSLPPVVAEPRTSGTSFHSQPVAVRFAAQFWIKLSAFLASDAFHSVSLANE